ncbi:response regulator [Paraliomyxa miuraensis]|uniref:response regulator n=1 Tax=Paraliomyxa miuraensis TaxID=376150 RepID=UPI002250612C|nr:response regulator [Paraliomyxa miuraensis]MCX4246840.1 response regulator [Paraliomyxa miuraensis]
MDLRGFVRRTLRAGVPEPALPGELEQAITRNGTLLLAGLVALTAATALGLTGNAFHCAMSSSAAVGCLLGAYLCMKGCPQIGVLITLLVVNVIVTLGVTAEGASHMAVLHILAVCLPFSLFSTRDRLPLLLAVVMSAAGMAISTIPLVPTPWLTPAGEDPGIVPAVASIGMLALIAAQLWMFYSSRNRMLLQLSVALDAANAASVTKSAFLANMSHEIRTPINGVLGMIGILEGTKLDAMQQEYLQTARTSGLALLDVINDILDLSKVEAGQLRLEPVPFELRATMEDILDQFAYQTTAKGVELVLRYVPGTPEHVVADAGRIRQVVTNLVSNAVKFTDRGHVLVTVSCKGASADRATLSLSVQDTGPGIPEERRAEIFDKFRQLDGSATRQHAGTGLGLTIMRELVQLMNGEVELDSVVGEGSTFRVTLPVDIDQDEISVRRSTPDELAAARVLIVDDHPVNRRVLCEQVTSWNMRNEQCESGAEALERLRRAKQRGEPFDLAVLDYQMPQMDGVALARAIKADAELSETTLILLTSVTLALDLGEIKAAGFAGYLVKPVHQSELLDVLAAALHARTEVTQGPLLTRHLLQEHQRDEVGGGLYEGLRVLVVDDNAINQKVAAKLLERLGCRIDLAGNGQEALELIDRVSYELVFMDVQMPVMDGLDATRTLRAKGVMVPVVAMTAHAMQGDRERCLAAGMNGYVSKPVQRDGLAREIAKLVNPRA